MSGKVVVLTSGAPFASWKEPSTPVPQACQASSNPAVAYPRSASDVPPLRFRASASIAISILVWLTLGPIEFHERQPILTARNL